MTQIKRLVSLMELNDIHYIAKLNFIEDTKLPEMDDQQFRSQCFIKAVCTILNIQGVEFPVRKNCEPLE